MTVAHQQFNIVFVLVGCARKKNVNRSNQKKENVARHTVSSLFCLCCKQFQHRLVYAHTVSTLLFRTSARGEKSHFFYFLFINHTEFE